MSNDLTRFKGKIETEGFDLYGTGIYVITNIIDGKDM